MQLEINASIAIFVCVLAIMLLIYFYRIKDGVGKIAVITFLSCVGTWAGIRAISMILYVHGIINAKTIQTITSYCHYLIYLPIIFLAIYLMRRNNDY